MGWLACELVAYAPRWAMTASEPNALIAHQAPAVWRVLLALWKRTPLENLPRFALSVELASGLFLVVLWLQIGPSWTFVLLAGAYAFFLLIALIDLKYRLVLNAMTYPAILAVTCANLLLIRQDARIILLGGALAFSIFYLTAWLKPGQLGGGDVKLALLMGLMFGFPYVLWPLIIGGGTGGLTALYLLRRGAGSKASIPYAPFLCLGVMVALLYNPFITLL